MWGVTVALYTYAIGHLGSLSFAGETINVGDFSAVWTIVLIVAALALAALTSVAWHLRRDTRESSLAQPGSWVVLPATYAVGGVARLAGAERRAGRRRGRRSARRRRCSPRSGWSFVLIVWGAAVEVASRFVAPSVAPALPPRLRALLRGPEPVGPVNPVRHVAGGRDASVEARPLTPEERARYKKIGIGVAGAVAVLGIVGWVAVSMVNSQFYGPEDQVAAYLDAVVDGDLDVGERPRARRRRPGRRQPADQRDLPRRRQPDHRLRDRRRREGRRHRHGRGPARGPG